MMSNMHKVGKIEIKNIADGSALQLTAGITCIDDIYKISQVMMIFCILAKHMSSFP